MDAPGGARVATEAGHSVTFTEAGALGLKFTPNKQTRNVEVLAINKGTQAERHPELRPGLVLTEVDGESVVGIGYPPTLALIKKAGRPVTLRFTTGGTVAAAVATEPADPTEGLTGAAAHRALQEHIMKSGTGDVKKIDRLRRASLQPDSKGPTPPQGQNDAAAMMAAAMAEVDDPRSKLDVSGLVNECREKH